MKMESILDKYSLSKRSDSGLAAIMMIESLLNYELPEDYNNFCTNYGEIELDIGEHILILFDILSLQEINDDYEIFKYCSDLLLIGTNGSSEGIAIDFKNDTSRIVLIPLIGLDRADFIEIGSSFTDMFKRLENGKSWFD